MAALARIPLLCAFAGLCSVACHAPSHHRHNAVTRPSADHEHRQPGLWGDDEQVASHACCTRVPRVVQIGHGMFGYGVQIDVGRCEKRCHTNHLTERNADVDDSRSEQVCPPDYSCRPSSSTLQRVYTRSGLEEVSVIDSCRCQEIPATCSRTDHTVLFYPGTPFETRLDVGSCAGHCHEGGCRPVRNKTISVPSPLGSSCQSVVEECGCTASCYRVTYEETIYDYTNVENGTDYADPELKVIDVGMCTGTCSAESAAQRCLIRDRSNPSRCLAGLYNKHSTCSPDAFRLHSYVTREQQTKEVVAITSCKCG